MKIELESLRKTVADITKYNEELKSYQSSFDSVIDEMKEVQQQNQELHDKISQQREEHKRERSSLLEKIANLEKQKHELDEAHSKSNFLFKI